MVRSAGLDEHADDDAEESREFWHAAMFACRSVSPLVAAEATFYPCPDPEPDPERATPDRACGKMAPRTAPVSCRARLALPMARSASLALAAAVGLAATVAARPSVAPRQPAPPSPRVGQQAPAVPPVSQDVDVTLVEVDAVVTDDQGRVLRNLRIDEFQVLEDGTPQTIDRVAFVEIPVARERRAAPGATGPPADVRTNQQGFDGRLYVLLLDDVHTALSRTDRVKAAARRFVEAHLAPGDVAAVVHLAGPPGAGQGFTSSGPLLLASVERFSGKALRSEALNLIDEYNEQMQLTAGAMRGGSLPSAEQVRDPDEPARADRARVVFDQIARVAQQVAPVRGRRKALVWFGEGLAYDMFDATGRRQASLVLESARRAVAAAGQANLAVYGVDVRGLQGVGQEVMQLSSPPDPSTGFDAARLARELARSQDNLRQISSDAGGFAIVNTEEFATAFDRVVEENSAYYLLGYYPRNAKADGAYRSLEVRVARPGARVRARRGYTLSRGPAAAALPGAAAVPAALRDVLAGPLQRPGLAMAVHAAPFLGAGGKTSLLVTVEYAAAAFAARGDATAGSDDLQALVVATDAEGRVQASDHASVDLRVSPETARAMAVLGFRTHTRLELAPGRYQLRVGGLLTATGLAGSVYRDIEVPDFSGTPLRMSGLALTCVVAAYTPTARADERLRGVLPAPPTTMRDFRNDDRLGVFAEVYDRGDVPRGDVAFSAIVRGIDGREALRRRELLTGDDLARARGRYTTQVPLGDLAPGDYVLRLEAAPASGEPVGQEAAFRVWAPEPDAGAATTPAGATGATAAASLPVVPVVKGAVSGVSSPREVVARGDGEWQALWATLPLKRAAPAVSFDSTMIVAVFLGERPTAGYEPDITAARLEDGTLVVEWAERAPGDPGGPPATTTPYVVAGVPMHAGPVRFEKRAVR